MLKRLPSSVTLASTGPDLMHKSNHQSSENLTRIIMLQSKVTGIEEEIQDIKEKLDLLGRAVAALIAKVDPDFKAK